MMSSKKKQLSQQVYYFRVHTEDAQAMTKTGPWLKPQLERTPTTISAAIKEVRSLSAKEALMTVEVVNKGPNPAYPVTLDIRPANNSVIWSDNYFWLRPGERITLRGLVRCDMTGLDLMTHPKKVKISDLALEISAWNARRLIVGQ